MTSSPHHAETSNPLLPPPEPMDQAGTRPPFNLTGMAVQVWLIQTFLARERTKKGIA
jgi:hypothetical protein